MKPAPLAVVLLAAVSVPSAAYSGGLGVTTSQDVYSYGDFLSFEVTVHEVVGDTATFRIIDESGVGSSTLAMAITDKTTQLVAPNPFLPGQFDVGTYSVWVQYGEDTATAEFELVDSGKTVIPFWIRDVAGLWVGGIIPDTAFLKNLSDGGIVSVDLYDGMRASIPSWCKSVAELWREGQISDDEFARSMQYLVMIDAIRTG